MPKALITLTTDFGTTDHFAGTMKGVILGIAPNAQIVDISHEVQAFEVTDGAFTIAEAYRYFPKKTIHVVVVDPGVGSTRRPLLAEMAGQYFIAPDNAGMFLRRWPRIWRREWRPRNSASSSRITCGSPFKRLRAPANTLGPEAS